MGGGRPSAELEHVVADLVDRVHGELVEGLGRAADPAVAVADARILELVRQADPLLSVAEVAATVAQVRSRLVGFGPLDPLLADPAVSDVLVNGPGPVWVERVGQLERTGVRLTAADIDLAVQRILAPLGRRVDPASPVVDARLPDGSRVHVVVPPLALDGTCLAIRRFAVAPVELGAIAAPPVAALLRWAVRARANLVVSGATGSGKTTLLNALGREVPAGERIVTVEDAAELRLGAAHVVRLEARPASADGASEVTIRELVRNALRMRPDRVIVGEVRGPEALDMVQAMNTGHDGSLSTLHANGCEDAVRRLETLVLLAGVGLPLAAVRDHLAAAVDLVVHVARSADGARRVVEVAEVLPPSGGVGPAVRVVARGHEVVAAVARGRRRAEAGRAPDPSGCGSVDRP